MPKRKGYPLKVPYSIWEDFLAAKKTRAPHLSLNDAINEALIQYAAAMDAGHVPEAAAGAKAEVHP